MEEKYVFLDRDGVINRDGAGATETGYIIKWDDFEFLPHVLEALKRFREAGYNCVIISNQQCVGKGYCSQDDLSVMTDEMSGAIKKAGGEIAGVFYCTHRKEEECTCRKPKAGLFLEAKDVLKISSMDGKYYIGDTERDIKAGRTAGLRTVLILSGKTGEDDVSRWQEEPDHIFDHLLAAAEFIIKNGR